MNIPRTIETEWQNEIARHAATGDTHEWATASLIYADWLEDHERGTEADTMRARAQQAARPLSLWPAASTLDALTPHQRDTLARCLVRPVCVLTGTPGTGKTYALAAVVRACRDVVAVAAPTGKAAVRCTQVLHECGMRGRATTIHQLLGIGRNGRDGRGWAFRHGPDNPLPYRYVIVDEASMLDVTLAASLFGACRPGTHVLLVGDTGQLPPVGHGSPLRDLVAAGVPCGELTEIVRNAGLIVRACAAIRRGEPFEVSDRYDPEAGLNLRHVEASTPAEALAALTGIVTRMRESGTFDPVTDVQVITPTNARSEVSRDALNTLLQGVLNPPGAGGSGETAGPYRLDDKIICLRNQYVHVPPTGVGGSYIANGDIGLVTDTTAGVVTVAFREPARTISFVPSGDSATDFALAYAVTGHKMQGSEVPCTIVMVDHTPAAARTVSREWWYTVISRATRLCITIGRRATLQYQARKPALARRKTFLAELLAGGHSR